MAQIDNSKPKAARLALALFSISFISNQAHAIPFPTQDVINHFIPKMELAATENCAEPGMGSTPGEAFYSVEAHPDNPDGAVLVTVSVLMLQDCGLSGHKDALGADFHEY